MFNGVHPLVYDYEVEEAKGNARVEERAKQDALTLLRELELYFEEHPEVPQSDSLLEKIHRLLEENK